ncbi:nucleotidyltransferase family protein [Kordiimonas marina]|uniref:nucleotidyltransferase family protein n=1 Tax=Kordiimonas marina TaxID=2872312 RepID=UPI001FF51255|nr:nucleotidyltransferase family protein [Kordiimonas marina]MCJ9430460.1 nucleotidyltransferase family protein [Kordiimonas marina]
MSAAALISFILTDPDAVRALEAVRDHGPAHAYIAAGFIRNRVWDSLYDPQPVAAESDVDVVYFDAGAADPIADEQAYEAALANILLAPWQVRNQARMHDRAGDPPYSGLSDALSRWPETATAVAVRLNGQGGLDVVAPFGLDDLMEHVLRPSQAILACDPGVFESRFVDKGWRDRWPRLRVIRP